MWFCLYFMCNIGQNISKTSMVTHNLFCMVETNVLQGIFMQIFKKLTSLLFFVVTHLNLVPAKYKKLFWQQNRVYLWIEQAGHEIRYFSILNSLWPSDATSWHRSGSTWAQVMACCLMATSHYLNQCWLTIFTGSVQDIKLQNEFLRTLVKLSLRHHWVNMWPWLMMLIPRKHGCHVAPPNEIRTR